MSRRATVEEVPDQGDPPPHSTSAGTDIPGDRKVSPPYRVIPNCIYLLVRSGGPTPSIISSTRSN